MRRHVSVWVHKHDKHDQLFAPQRFFFVILVFINLLNSFPTLIATYRYKFDLHCPIYHFQFRSIVTASASTC